MRSGKRLLVLATLIAFGASQAAAHDPDGNPPEPTVTYTAQDAREGERVEHGELIGPIDATRKALHALHHPHGILENRRVPGTFAKPAMDKVSDFALSKDDLVVINPGPGEYVHVMEGQRHGYRNLTIGITYTAPGGAPPMHTHKGEESHVLTKHQKVLYALGDEIFVFEGPFMVNIPPMVTHSFSTQSRAACLLESVAAINSSLKGL